MSPTYSPSPTSVTNINVAMRPNRVFMIAESIALNYHYPLSMIPQFFPICLFQFCNLVTEKLNLKIF